MVREFLANPLPTSFMVFAMIGFLVSALYVWDISLTWGFTFCVVFGIWFFAAVYNFTHAE